MKAPSIMKARDLGARIPGMTTVSTDDARTGKFLLRMARCGK
jgi:hypothetical protein